MRDHERRKRTGWDREAVSHFYHEATEWAQRWPPETIWKERREASA